MTPRRSRLHVPRGGAARFSAMGGAGVAVAHGSMRVFTVYCRIPGPDAPPAAPSLPLAPQTTITCAARTRRTRPSASRGRTEPAAGHGRGRHSPPPPTPLDQLLRLGAGLRETGGMQGTVGGAGHSAQPRFCARGFAFSSRACAGGWRHRLQVWLRMAWFWTWVDVGWVLGLDARG